MKQVSERDVRMPEFREANLDDLEFDGTGEVVRKDRWEMAIRSIVGMLEDHGHATIRRRKFGIPEVLTAVCECLNGEPAQNLQQLCDWAVASWKLEVQDRPLINKNRRTLDDTWRQVIRFAGGDPDVLIGPAHDVLVAANKELPE